MTRALWLKKIWKGRSKGVSSVIGTVFLILVIFAISTNVFLWTISQSSLYNQEVKDVNQKDADRMNENVVATDGNLTVLSGNKVKVEAKLTNVGSVAAQLINLWVFDISKQTYGFNNSIASIDESNLNPGKAWNLSGSSAIIVTVPNVVSEDSINAWFVTARGNNVLITLYVPEIEPGTGGALVGGPFLLLFSNDAFQYTSDGNPTSPLPAFRIDNDRIRIIFSILFHNRADRGIQISNNSFFLVEVRQLTAQGVPGTTEYERYFQLVGPTSNSNPSGLVAYTPDYMQTIPARQDTTLKFGASTVGGTSFLSGEPLHGDSGNGDSWSNLLWTFIVIFWRYAPIPGEPNPPTFGQTITYVAILTDP